MLDCPSNEKYRQLKKTNATIAAKVMSVPGIKELLLDLGFIELDSDFMVYAEDSLAVVGRVLHAIDEYIASYGQVTPAAKVLEIKAKTETAKVKAQTEHILVLTSEQLVEAVPGRP